VAEDVRSKTPTKARRQLTTDTIDGICFVTKACWIGAKTVASCTRLIIIIIIIIISIIIIYKAECPAVVRLRP
jgi:hypothetical protein